MPNRRLEIPIGSTWTRLTVLKETSVSGSNKVHYLCRCDCGKEVTVRGSYLLSGRVKSCGCLRRQTTGIMGSTRDRRSFAFKAGRRFGRLTVVSIDSIGKSALGEDAVKGTIYRCMCECGRECLKEHHYLRFGAKSCGCLWKERTREAGKLRRTHGMSKSTEYRAWRSMQARCHNPKCKSYPHYGGRGITICDRWVDSFENFLEDMGRRPPGKYSLDRIDVNGNYQPDNCRWATDEMQNNNRRPMKRIADFTAEELEAELKRRR
jgi:hypothetical protein